MPIFFILFLKLNAGSKAVKRSSLVSRGRQGYT
jgi:hypothetical protein